MKCRYANGKSSIVVSTNRSGVASLGAVLQDIIDIDLFAVCTENSNFDRLWTTLWYRKANRDVAFNSNVTGLPYIVLRDIEAVRFDILSYRSESPSIQSYEKRIEAANLLKVGESIRW